VSVLVCSPELPSSRATTIDQMRLLSLLCAYIEDASKWASRLRLGAAVKRVDHLAPLAVAARTTKSVTASASDGGLGGLSENVPTVCLALPAKKSSSSQT